MGATTLAPPADRPLVWLNCAVSADGRLAFAEGARARLSSPEDLARVHRLRSEVEGIVVGVGTVLLDDPTLRVRWDLLGRPAGTPPARIVLDGSGRTPAEARVLDGTAPTIVATSARSHRAFPPTIRTLVAGEREVEIPTLLRGLHQLGLRRILVEGGAHVLASVARSGLFDRWTVYYAPVVIGGATAPSMLAGPESRTFDDVVRLSLERIDRTGEGFVATYRPRDEPRPSTPLGGASAPQR